MRMLTRQAGRLAHVTLRLYDTATRDIRDFTPRQAGCVGVYVCGATVQSAPHIGHMRSAVAFDVLVRWLRRSNYNVTYIRNVTDIDDKILAKSADAAMPWWAWAAHNERLFTHAYDVLGNLPPTYEPRATGHMMDMIDLMTTLIERGHAYVASEGNVYFDTRSWPDYGVLTNQHIDETVLSAQDLADSNKRDPRDFALWKAPKPGEPDTASWNTPYGSGRPGWHLECSAMARRYLGDEFDIHGGGLDLRFPHHENEQAQSRAAGHGFANHWMHSAWVTQSGAKMSKSLGNGLLVTEVLTTAPAAVLRFALASVHYRSMLEWTDQSVTDAHAAWDKFTGLYTRAVELLGEAVTGDIHNIELPAPFTTALNDDLNVAQGLAVIYEHVKAANTALAERDTDHALNEVLVVRAMLDILGLDPANWQQDCGDARETTALAALVQGQLDQRAQARADKNWATSDAIRDALAAAGIIVEDSPHGARWSLN